MNFISVLYYLIIRPLELVYEFIFSVSFKVSNSTLLSIFFLSLTVNLLALPLYKRADAIQQEERDLEASLKNGIRHIKKTFKGDERFMMLTTYYNQNNYSPLYILKGSLSLFLQIPFFIAAYRVLSVSAALQGTSLGPIADLGSPDRIIHFGSLGINLLPLLMTFINIISSAIYAKDLDIKANIQLYGTALVFLILLYDSPSGLVLYWTLNNLFSLCKNIVMKLIPTVKEYKENNHNINFQGTSIFVLYALCLSVFIGILIPSDFLSQSAGDFFLNYRTISLTHYVWISFFISLGFFLIWGGIFYFISANKKTATGTMVTLLLFALLNYFAFYKNNGDINRYLNIRFYNSDSFTDILTNIFILAITTVLVIIVMRNRPVFFKHIAVVALLTIASASFINMRSIYNETNDYRYIENQRDYPELTLSSDGKNVVVIMLDRAIGRLIPYIFNENPSLIDSYDGFVYYSNSLSFGCSTNQGFPAICGGYEYTPEAMNIRDYMSLADKHNEALKVMPVLFSENGYNVTVLNPTYAGYMEIPNLSIFDDYPDIESYVTPGALNPYFDSITDDWNHFMERNLFSYSLRLVAPIFLREVLYDEGYYNEINRRLSDTSYFQNISDISHANGLDFDFLNAYYDLINLPTITRIENTEENNTGSYVFMVNNTAHNPMMLSEPDYSVSTIIDNSEYDMENADRFTLDNNTIDMNYTDRLIHYQCQMAAMVSLGEWFDYLREQGIYDNTRIILVSDHGDEIFGYAPNGLSIWDHNCLMMVKDFDSHGFSTSTEFITNAETVSLATNNLINNPVNPFTGNELSSQMGNAESFHYFSSEERFISNNNTFLPGSWYTYDPESGDIMDYNAWTYVGDH